MNVTIKNKVIELNYGVRAMLLFERLLTQSETANNGGLSTLTYCLFACIAGSKDGKGVSYEDVIDYLEENKDKITEFSEWIVSQQSFIPAKKNLDLMKENQ